MEEHLMGELTRLQTIGDVRHLVLDAPERRNALDLPMLKEIRDAVRAVARDSSARALVVSGEGKAFCAGADVKSLFGDPSRPPAEIRADLKVVYDSFLGIAALKIPTLAAVNGVAVGAGVNIAMACDMVIGGRRAKFAVTFAEIGLHPGGGCSWFLTRRMGGHRAMATILGAETLDADEALLSGLITKLSDEPVEKALEMAHLYAQREPGLVRDMKRAVQIAEACELGAALEFESWAQASSVNKPKFQEFMARFAD
jgi:enoyl-CoA hydratase